MNPTERIDRLIASLTDWRSKTLGAVRKIILGVDPEIIEEWKWRGVPVWYRDGMICTGETYKSIVKLTFANGAALEDPAGLFNSSLEGNTRRAIDFHEDDKVNEHALKNLLRAAIAYNQSKKKKKPEAPSRAAAGSGKQR